MLCLWLFLNESPTWGPDSPLSPFSPGTPGGPWKGQETKHVKQSLTIAWQQGGEADYTYQRTRSACQTHWTRGATHGKLKQKRSIVTNKHIQNVKVYTESNERRSTVTRACCMIACIWASCADTAGPFCPDSPPALILNCGRFEIRSVNYFS